MKSILPISLHLLLAASVHAQARLPVIDVHLHAQGAGAQGPPPLGLCTPIADPWPAWDPVTPYPEAFMAMFKEPACDDPIWSPMTDQEVLDRTLAVMERHNVYGVLSGDADRVAAWTKAAPGRFMPAFTPEGAAAPADGAAAIRELHARGGVAALAELGPQYAADHERLDPYWAVAKELDIPVGVHIGPGPPGVIYLGASGSRARLQSAFILEDVLVKHPGVRVYIMHAGYPLLEDVMAVLYAHPHVYVDIGIIAFGFPRASFYRHLEGLIEAGLGTRIMFGSDQMVWPEVIERAITAVEEAPFLSEAQKRDILYNNAARFLRLSESEIARHHGR